MTNPERKIPIPIDGIILVDKPTGWTSHDCVASVRRLCPRKTKVGHGGTLDPFSTGLLILLVGKATRLAHLFQGMEKAYEGVIRFGEGTDSFDRDGKVLHEGPPPKLTEEEWLAQANGFIGRSMQIPPAFSAKRLGGKRAYELARKGEAPELEPCSVEIFEFDIQPVSETDIRFRVRGSSGTYIRALARDLGERVDSPAHCYELSRTGVGSLKLVQANQMENPFEGAGFIPFDLVELDMPIHRADHREERLVLFGQKIHAPLQLQGHSGFVKVVSPAGRFLALGKLDARQIHPVTVFPETT